MFSNTDVIVADGIISEYQILKNFFSDDEMRLATQSEILQHSTHKL